MNLSNENRSMYLLTPILASTCSEKKEGRIVVMGGKTVADINLS